MFVLDSIARWRGWADQDLSMETQTMSARTWFQDLTEQRGRSSRRSNARLKRRLRPFVPAPEGLENRMLLAGAPPAGSLDPTFGTAGLVTTQFGGDDSNSVGALQSDGKIVVAGSVSEPSGADTIGLARYLSDGQLDSSFGSSGTGEVLLDPSLEFDDVSAVAVIDRPGQPDDGKIVVAGGWTDPNTFQRGVALARFNPNGTLDTSFGKGGEVRDARTTDRAMAVTIQADDKIVVSGRTLANGNFRGFVERYNPDGTPDGGFANPGVAAAPAGWTLQLAQALAFDPNRGLFVAGSDGLHIEVAHLNDGGQLDASFGTGGIATANFAGGSVSDVGGLSIDPNRGLVVAATAFGGTPAQFSTIVTRLDFQGNLEPSFNNGQMAVVDFIGSPNSRSSGVAVQSDGKVLLTVDYGATPESLPFGFALARLNADGTADNGFGTGGSVVTGFSGLTGNRAFNSASESVLLQPDGQIVLAGWAGSDFALARYLGSGGVPIPIPQPPVVGPITTPAPVLSGTPALVSASFTYNIPTDQHTAQWNWGDGMTSAGNVTETGGMGTVTGSHVYAAPGIYQVTLTVTDQSGASGSATAIPGVVVFNMLIGGITGNGMFIGPPFAIAVTPSGKVRFQLAAKYAGNRAIPLGKAMFQFTEAHRVFRSARSDWLVIAGRTAWYQGTGTLDGKGTYGFLVSASSGGRPAARIRIRIWNKATGTVIYDTEPGAPASAAPLTPIRGGRIVLKVSHLHKR
jgi:uncharacterized delta-60 repeat protein